MQDSKRVHAIEYRAKYICKGTERAAIAISDCCDEILITLQDQYISCMEAHHYLIKYQTYYETPAVMMLPFHLENRQSCFWGKLLYVSITFRPKLPELSYFRLKAVQVTGQEY